MADSTKVDGQCGIRTEVYDRDTTDVYDIVFFFFFFFFFHKGKLLNQSISVHLSLGRNKILSRSLQTKLASSTRFESTNAN